MWFQQSVSIADHILSIVGKEDFLDTTIHCNGLGAVQLPPPLFLLPYCILHMMWAVTKLDRSKLPWYLADPPPPWRRLNKGWRGNDQSCPCWIYWGLGEVLTASHMQAQFNCNTGKETSFQSRSAHQTNIYQPCSAQPKILAHFLPTPSASDSPHFNVEQFCYDGTGELEKEKIRDEM